MSGWRAKYLLDLLRLPLLEVLERLRCAKERGDVVPQRLLQRQTANQCTVAWVRAQQQLLAPEDSVIIKQMTQRFSTQSHHHQATVMRKLTHTLVEDVASEGHGEREAVCNDLRNPNSSACSTSRSTNGTVLLSAHASAFQQEVD